MLSRDGVARAKLHMGPIPILLCTKMCYTIPVVKVLSVSSTEYTMAEYALHIIFLVETNASGCIDIHNLLYTIFGVTLFWPCFRFRHSNTHTYTHTFKFHWVSPENPLRYFAKIQIAFHHLVWLSPSLSMVN